MKKTTKKSLRHIPTGRLARGFKLARLTASMGVDHIGTKVASVFRGRIQKEADEVLFQIGQARKVTRALSELKGAAMKLGQILSIHAEEFFPREVVEILETLQKESDQMDFDQIEKVLVDELGPKYGTELCSVSASPIASASIGQVHRGIFAAEQLPVAVKVQYPGVDKSIDSDIESLASLLGVLARFPKNEGFREITDEIKTILRQETDYVLEGKSYVFFKQLYSNDPHLVVPRFIPEVSTKRVLVTELVSGLSVSQFAESSATVEQRGFVGAKYLETFYRELFEAGVLQTDPNFGNYLIQAREGGHAGRTGGARRDGPSLVLLDFGAIKRLPSDFRLRYIELLGACIRDDYAAIREASMACGILRPDDPKESVDLHYELSRLLSEPFRHDDRLFDWAESDLAARIRKLIPRFIFSFKLRPPPRDFVFLNRKIAGIYFFCSAIRAAFKPRELLDRFLTMA